jgi:hypothetical protein
MSNKDYARVQYVTQRIRDGFDFIFQGNFKLGQHYHGKEGTIDFDIHGMPNEILNADQKFQALSASLDNASKSIGKAFLPSYQAPSLLGAYIICFSLLNLST